jgi:hypothetical protein
MTEVQVNVGISVADQTKLFIAAISVVPYLIVILLLLIPLYVVNKKPLLGAKWKDALLWIGSILVYYGVSVGIMYVPWPMPKFVEP